MTTGRDPRLQPWPAALVGAAYMVLAGAATAQTAPPWQTRFFNPKPAEGDFSLPLPCGGTMMFRPVDVPLPKDGPLEDKPMTLGSPDNRFGYREYIRAAYLTAPFPIPGEPRGAAGRRYYLGKYDVTSDQYAAMLNDCHAPTATGLAAMSEVSYPEAIAAGAAWSTWLLANARDKLPKRGEELAFARLPTDDEWEYAARGGANVDGDDFLAPTWPMQEGAARYVVAGSNVVSPHAQQVGLRLPNPLGLYDMLGNVGQMTLEPFRLNRVGRDHGQAGGITVRGGNYTYAPGDLYTALRTEVPPYDQTKNAPTKLATMGFRLVLSTTAAAGGSAALVDDIRGAFSGISDAARNSDDDTENAPRLLDQLVKDTPDAETQRKLKIVQAAMSGDHRARMDAANEALSADLRAGLAVAHYVWQLDHNARVIEAQQPMPNHPEDKAVFAAQAQARRDEEAGALVIYLDLITQISKSILKDDIEAHMRDLDSTLVGQGALTVGRAQLRAFMPVLTRHAVLMRDRHALDRAAAQKDITGVAVTSR